MTKIKDLIQFQKIRDVIDIDQMGNKQDMVQNYVISPSLEDYLVNVFGDFNLDVHKAVQIIGGYGSGKSHLLGFIISVLSDRNLSQYISNKRVREAAEKISRDFVVIQWELQPNNKVSLADYFYYQIKTLLYQNYHIKYEFDLTPPVDHKKEILKLLDVIKQEDPKRGFVVVIDEISDFLKQKTKENIQSDVQFLRVLGQVAQDSDFSFVGSMQEHVFSNPKYVDEADSLGRVQERFQLVTIKREDIEKVIAKRVLNKSQTQRLELEDLFSDYAKIYPEVNSNLDKFIDLFPLHPYVIDVFSTLPYFERRGIIQFTIEQVSHILDDEFPSLITYDRIYDLIESKHTVKHLEDVSPIINAINTLSSKIDLLDESDKDIAAKVIKALAVLKLHGKTLNNGATPEELANELLIVPSRLNAEDEITLVLNKLRKVTDGQFINRTEDDYYYLDLALTVDYDQVIERRAENLSESSLDDEILGILRDQLYFREEIERGIFRDTCNWTSRKSFREGLFIYENGKQDMYHEDGDFQVIFVSPLFANNRYKPTPNRLVISCKLDNDVIETLKLTAAARELLNDNYQRDIIKKKHVQLSKNLKKEMVKSYLENGIVEIGSERKSITAVISREFSNFDEMLSDIKPAMFDDYFTDKYPQHPKFVQAISRDNIAGEFSTAAKYLVSQTQNQTTLYGTSKSILGALGLLDAKGNFSTENSDVANQILDAAKQNEGQNLPIENFIEEYEDVPYGYDPLMTEFIILALTYNGQISMKAAGGKTISSSEIEEVFKTGMDAFENIRYLTLEGDINVQPVISLFRALGVDNKSTQMLRSTSKRNEAIKAFRSQYLQLEESKKYVDVQLKNISITHNSEIDVDGLKAKHELLEQIPFDEFEKVKTPMGLKHLIYDNDKINSIYEAVKMLQKLTGFYDTYTSKIDSELTYALKVEQILDDYSSLFDNVANIKQFIDDSRSILEDADMLIESSYYNSLVGKLEQVKTKYLSTYYHAHEEHVGSKVNWDKLESIIQMPVYRKLKTLKNVELLDRNNFLGLEGRISSLKQLKCTAFKPEMLDKNVLCPKCSFPEGFKNEDIETQIARMENDVVNIYEDWESTILSELDNYRDNIQYLTDSEQQVIQSIIANGELPDTISNDLVVAINNLFKELESIEIDPKEFMKEVFNNSSVLDYSTFTSKLQSAQKRLISGKDASKVRIKLLNKD